MAASATYSSAVSANKPMSCDGSATSNDSSAGPGNGSATPGDGSMSCADGADREMRARHCNRAVACASGRVRSVPTVLGAACPSRLRMPATTASTMPWPMPRARTPPPPASAYVAPVTVVEGRPAPRVSGDEGPAPARVIAPGTIVIRIPVRADSVGLPNLSITG
jgi:hypothetical protein